MSDSTRDYVDSLSPDQLLGLDHQLCFALYVCSKEIIRKYKPLLDPLGLTYTSYITLLALWEKDQINVKDLGEKLYLDSGTLTPILKKLEIAGFITRDRSKSDERNVYISLTKEGHLLKEKAAEVPRNMICSLSEPPESLDTKKMSPDLLFELHHLMHTLTK